MQNYPSPPETFKQIYKHDHRFERLCGIYAIRNIKTGHHYIGQSVDIYARLQTHISELRCNKHYNSYFSRAFNKYGEESYVCFILELCPEDDLNVRELHYLEKFECLKTDKGYNLTANFFPRQQVRDKHHTKFAENVRKAFIKRSPLKFGDIRVIRELHNEGYSDAEIFKIYKGYYKNKCSINAIIKNRQWPDPSYNPNQIEILNLRDRNILHRIVSEFGMNKGLMMKLYEALKGRCPTAIRKYFKLHYGDKPTKYQVLNTSTGVFYDSIQQAAVSSGYSHSTLTNHLLRNQNNVTDFVIC